MSTAKPLPVCDEIAFHGFAGHFVNSLAPTTEASPAALLLTLLAAAGAYVGNGPHLMLGDSQHPARVWPLIVGRSGGGRKGTSFSCVERVLTVAFSDFTRDNVLTGFSTGEGLIANVRDAEEEDPTQPESVQRKRDRGVTDKRRLAVLDEFGGTLKASGRRDNTLSPVLRQAWDGKTLSVLTRGDPVKATQPHIAVIGHITPAELRAQATGVDIMNGFFNRFLLAVVHQSQLLPRHNSAPDSVVAVLAADLRRNLDRARGLGRVRMTDQAEKVYDQLYTVLNDYPDDPILEALAARSAPQLCRIALCFALVDGRHEIAEDDLMAAFAVWEFSLDSAKYLFGSISPVTELDRLKQAVRDAGPDGLTQTEGHQLFSNKKSAHELRRLLVEMCEDGSYRHMRSKTGGRDVQVYFYETPVSTAAV